MRADGCCESSKSPRYPRPRQENCWKERKRKVPSYEGSLLVCTTFNQLFNNVLHEKVNRMKLMCVGQCVHSPDLVSMLQGTGNTRIGPAEVGGDEGMIGKPPVAAAAAADWRGSWGSAVVTNAGGGTLKSTLKSRSYSMSILCLYVAYFILSILLFSRFNDRNLFTIHNTQLRHEEMEGQEDDAYLSLPVWVSTCHKYHVFGLDGSL